MRMDFLFFRTNISLLAKQCESSRLLRLSVASCFLVDGRENNDCVGADHGR